MLYTRSSADVTYSGGATLRVVGNFSKFLKVIRNYSVEYGMCKFLLVFHCNRVSILYRFWDIQCRIMACPWNNLG